MTYFDKKIIDENPPSLKDIDVFTQKIMTSIHVYPKTCLIPPTCHIWMPIIFSIIGDIHYYKKTRSGGKHKFFKITMWYKWKLMANEVLQNGIFDDFEKTNMFWVILLGDEIPVILHWEMSWLCDVQGQSLQRILLWITTSDSDVVHSNVRCDIIHMPTQCRNHHR